MKTKIYLQTVYVQAIVQCRTLCPYTETAHRNVLTLLREEY